MSGMFYSNQTDYIAKMNLLADGNTKNILTTSTVGASSITLDLSLAHVHYLTVSSAGICNLTFLITNKPATGIPFEITLYLKSTTTNVHTFVSWPTTTVWAQTPVGGANANTWIYKLLNDGGSTYLGVNLNPTPSVGWAV